MKFKKYLVIFVFCCLFGFAMVLLFKNSNKKDTEHNAQIMFRLAETYPEEHPSAMAAKRFADLVYERTNGRIQIKIYYNGELGSEPEVLEQMQFGGIALARVSLLRLSDIVPALRKEIKPYAYKSSEEMLDYLEESDSDFALKLQLEKLIPLVCYYPDKRCFFNNKTTLNNLKDFEGLKIKVESTGIMHTIIRELGGEPVEVLSSNTFKSLRAGYVDGGETSLCNFMLSDYYSVISYVTLSDYMYSPDIIVASIPSISGLNKKDQKLLAECAKATLDYQKELLSEFQRKSIDRLNEKTNNTALNPDLEKAIRQLFLYENKEKQSER